MSLPSALATAALTDRLLARTSLGDRFDVVVGAAPGHRAWLSAVAAFNNLGDLVGLPPDVTHASVVHAANRPGQVRDVILRWFGQADYRYLFRAVTAGWDGVVYPEVNSRRLSHAFTAELLALDDRLQTAFHDAVRPAPMGGYVPQRMLSGLVALAVQLHHGAGFREAIEDWPSLRRTADRRLDDLGLVRTGITWPVTPPTGLPTSPGVLVIEEDFDHVVERAIHFGLDLIRAGRVDNIVFACPTRTGVIHVYDQLHELFGDLIVRGLPWDVESAHGWFNRTERYLLAPVCITTQEQVFNSIRRERHAYLRSTALARSLLIMGNPYAEDARQQHLVRALCHHQILVGGYAALTSAVLDWHTRQWALLERWPGPPPQEEVDEIQNATTEQDRMGAKRVRYPSAHHGEWSGPIRDVSHGPQGAEDFIEVEWVNDGPPASVAREAVQLACARNARVLVVRNLRREARETAQEVVRLGGPILRVNDHPVLFHTDYTPEDRHVINDAVVGQDSGPCIIVATRHIEDDLRFYADIILTDFCPMDALLRRASRLQHRGSGRLFILRPPPRPAQLPAPGQPPAPPGAHRTFLEYVGPNGAPRRRPHGIGPRSIYRNLFVLQATWTWLVQRGGISFGNPRGAIEWCLHEESAHPYPHPSLNQRPDLNNHRRWLLNEEQPTAVAAGSLRWPPHGLFGDQNCDVPQNNPWMQPREVYIQGRPVIRVWFPGCVSPLGTVMRALVIERQGDFTEGQPVNDPQPYGIGFWRFGAEERHVYDNFGYHYNDEDEDL
jgi:hypothetical protein